MTNEERAWAIAEPIAEGNDRGDFAATVIRKALADITKALDEAEQRAGEEILDEINKSLCAEHREIHRHGLDGCDLCRAAERERAGVLRWLLDQSKVDDWPLSQGAEEYAEMIGRGAHAKIRARGEEKNDE